MSVISTSHVALKELFENVTIIIDFIKEINFNHLV